MQEMGAYFWVLMKGIGQLESTVIFPAEQSEVVVIRGVHKKESNGSCGEGQMYSIPQGSSFKSPFYQWHFLGIFSHKYLANGVCPWKANAVRLVESRDCGKGRAGTAEGSAAVSLWE